jgi:hypothetical protein
MDSSDVIPFASPWRRTKPQKLNRVSLWELMIRQPFYLWTRFRHSRTYHGQNVCIIGGYAHRGRAQDRREYWQKLKSLNWKMDIRLSR